MYTDTDIQRMVKRKRVKTIVHKFDSIVGVWVRKCGKCQHCSSKVTTNLQWCHIKSRKFYNLRWDRDNYFCLCAPCHSKFHDSPDSFILWIESKFPGQLDRLNHKFRQTTKHNLVFWQDWGRTISEMIEQPFISHAVIDHAV